MLEGYPIQLKNNKKTVGMKINTQMDLLNFSTLQPFNQTKNLKTSDKKNNTQSELNLSTFQPFNFKTYSI